MFEKHSCNMKPIDSYIRFILATIILIYAFYASYFVLILVSLLLYYTASKKFCFAYYFLKINERLSKHNYYLTFLPKYNPSAVFIFNAGGEVIFRNNAADKNITCLHSISDMNIKEHKKIIKENQLVSLMFVCHEKTYQIQLQGIAKERFSLAYLTDVTEVLALNDEIEETQREVIYAMGEIGETRSKETGHHVKRVAMYSKELALLYGLTQEEADKLQMASPMHDIGKVGIPDAILNAPRALDTEEWKVMQTHAQLGYDMLKSSKKPILQAAAIVAHDHHEKFDGSGYPRGLSGEDIHIYGRITALADVFDALGSERVYKQAWELERILTLFKEESGKHFDPKLVDLFLNNLDTFLKIRDTFKD
jgi:putative two-component system response regulator